MGYKHRIKPQNLLGKTIAEIQGSENDEELVFILDDGSKVYMFHEQDCCESVSIEDITGDLKDLIGNPLLQAEVVTNDEPDEIFINARKAEYEKQKAEYEKVGRLPYYINLEHYLESKYESETWTFYKFATIKGSVTIRWYGTSNGYYSERVDLELFPPGENRVR